jgi:hypothetical protein
MKWAPRSDCIVCTLWEMSSSRWVHLAKDWTWPSPSMTASCDLVGEEVEPSCGLGWGAQEHDLVPCTFAVCLR